MTGGISSGCDVDLAIPPCKRMSQLLEKIEQLKEAAISKTETTSARALSCWYCTEMEKHGVVAVKTVLIKLAGRN